MAIRISQLDDGGFAQPGDEIPVTRAGFTKRVILPERGVSLLQRLVDTFTLDAVISPLVNYTLKVEQGFMTGEGDAVAGEIETPDAGFYIVSALVVGLMATPANNSSTSLYIRLANAGGLDGDYEVSVINVPSIQSVNVGLFGTISFNLPAAAVISLVMDASVAQGIFTPTNVSFEVGRA